MKTRLDALLVERGLAESRARAQVLVRAGHVTVSGRREDKPGTLVPADAAVEVRATERYASRGAHKLVGALDAFGISPAGLACLDVGASTGGFTDALLQRGARVVFAVDVGRGQLAWRLRQDPRVVNLERTDVRALGALPEPAGLAAVDVSFISLRLVLPPIGALLAARAPVLALVKPQFEAGRGRVGRGGIVRDHGVHRAVLEHLATWLADHGWCVLDAAPSPITGAAGNREFWLSLRRQRDQPDGLQAQQILARAFRDRGAGTPDCQRGSAPLAV